MALGIPLSLAAGLAAPRLWVIGAGWSLCALGLLELDFVLGASSRRMEINTGLPSLLGVGRSREAAISLAFTGRAPRMAEIELQGDARLDVKPRRQSRMPENGVISAVFDLLPLRRGEAHLENLWLRWTGPLGLAWIQYAHPLPHAIAVLPDVENVREQAMRLFQRDSQLGLQTQLDRGRGAEFHALRDFQLGHDLRQIDWKQSARHKIPIVKEFRVEQNQHIVAALDTGRLMSEPVAGQSRLDRALHAILLLAFVGLKLGDRFRLFAFDSKPRLRSGSVSGVRAFPALQRLASQLEYCDDETNFTLGLTQLAGDLEHRSTIVLFSDFSDTTSAELMTPFLGWTLIHGVTELFAVTLAGAAGFRIGWALAFPGEKSRLAAAADAGRIAATVMAGVVIMLAIAGLLEGFGRQLITATALRYGIGAASALLWGSYFYAYGTRR